jgi:Tol biopolymer transport system component
VDPVSGSQGTEAPERLPGFPSTASVFAWSPDMSRIAFVEYNSPEVSIYSTDRRALASYRVDPAPWHFRVGWSSDGKDVLYQGRRNSAGVNWLAFDPSTGQVRELIPRRPDRIVQALSADGRRVLYDDTTGALYVADAGQASGVRVAERVAPDGGARSSLVRNQLSPRGDQVLFGRQSNSGDGHYEPAAGTLWVVASEGTNLRRVGTPIYMVTSAVWDPSGRFVAYSGLKDSTTTVLRVVELATGAEHDFRLPNPPDPKASLLRVVDWSADGKYLGVVLPEYRAEYWVVQGLEGRE